MAPGVPSQLPATLRVPKGAHDFLPSLWTHIFGPECLPQGLPTFDVLILNGVVVDGTGARGYRADVGVVGERIDAIGDLAHAETRRVINAAGLTVAPGFIDTHTHSEGDLLVNAQHACGLRQGITTEFLGIDGMSYAPLSAENYRTYRHWLSGLL